MFRKYTIPVYDIYILYIVHYCIFCTVYFCTFNSLNTLKLTCFLATICVPDGLRIMFVWYPPQSEEQLGVTLHRSASGGAQPLPLPSPGGEGIKPPNRQRRALSRMNSLPSATYVYECREGSTRETRLLDGTRVRRRYLPQDIAPVCQGFRGCYYRSHDAPLQPPEITAVISKSVGCLCRRLIKFSIGARTLP